MAGPFSASRVFARARTSGGRQRGIGDRTPTVAAAVLVAPAALLLLLAPTGAAAEDWRLAAVLVVAAAGIASLAGVGVPRGGGAHAATVAFFLLAGWTALSYTWSPEPGTSADEALRTVAYATLFAVVSAAATSWRRVRLCLLATGCAVGLLSSYTAIRLSIGPPPAWFDSDRLPWPTDYANTAAATYVIGFWILAGAAAVRASSPWTRGAAQGAATLALGVAAIADSRGATACLILTAALVAVVAAGRARLAATVGITGAAIAIAALPLRAALDTGPSAETASAMRVLLAVAAGAGLVTGLVAWLERERGLVVPLPGRRLTIAAVSIASALAVGGMAAIDAPERVRDAWTSFTAVDAQPFDGAGTRLTTVDSNRWDFWRVAAGALAREPALGSGAGTFDRAYREDGRSSELPTHAHGQVLEAGATLGVPGIIALLAIAAIAVAGLGLAARRKRQDAPLIAAGFAALVGALLHAQLDRHWEFPGLSFTIVALAACGASLLRRARPSREVL